MHLPPHQSVLELSPDEFGPEALEEAFQRLQKDGWHVAAVIVPLGTKGDHESLFNHEMSMEWKGIPFIVMDVPPKFDVNFKRPWIKIFGWKYEETEKEAESSSEAPSSKEM